jgi:hypothetical protein
MGKRLGVLGAALAVVAPAVGAISPAWGSSTNKDKQTTFRVDAVTTEQSFEGISLGDPAPYAVAVTGGSGRYQGAEGEVRVQPGSDTRGP